MALAKHSCTEAISLENPKCLQWSFPWRQNFCHCMLGMSTWLINIKQARVWIAKAITAPYWLLMSVLFRHVQLFGGKSCTGHEITCSLLKGSDGQDGLLGDKLWCESEAMLVASQFLPEGWTWGSSCHLDWRCPACGWAVRGAVSLTGLTLQWLVPLLMPGACPGSVRSHRRWTVKLHSCTGNAWTPQVTVLRNLWDE